MLIMALRLQLAPGETLVAALNALVNSGCSPHRTVRVVALTLEHLLLSVNVKVFQSAPPRGGRLAPL